MTNLGFIKFCEREDIRFIATKVGDRFVMEEMLLEEYSFGGEQSGHLIFRDFATTGDGELTAIQVLGIMRREGRKLSELASVMTRYPQVMINVRVSAMASCSSIRTPRSSAPWTKPSANWARRAASWRASPAPSRSFASWSRARTTNTYAPWPSAWPASCANASGNRRHIFPRAVRAQGAYGKPPLIRKRSAAVFRLPSLSTARKIRKEPLCAAA